MASEKIDLFEEATFHFQEKVAVKKGFYRGYKGVVESVERDKEETLVYAVKLDKSKKVVKVTDDQIRKLWNLFGFEV